MNVPKTILMLEFFISIWYQILEIIYKALYAVVSLKIITNFSSKHIFKALERFNHDTIAKKQCQQLCQAHTQTHVYYTKLIIDTNGNDFRNILMKIHIKIWFWFCVCSILIDKWILFNFVLSNMLEQYLFVYCIRKFKSKNTQ